MPERYPRQNRRSAWRVYDGRAVIVSPEDSRLHSLNEVGTCIWEAADGRTSVEDIAARLVGAFEVTPERARADADAFLDELARRGLVTMANTPHSEEDR
jgi:hypothetical protein